MSETTTTLIFTVALEKPGERTLKDGILVDSDEARALVRACLALLQRPCNAAFHARMCALLAECRDETNKTSGT